MEFTIHSGQILGFCTFVAAIWSIWKIIKELKKPNDDLRVEVNKHSKLLSDDRIRLNEIENSNKMVLKSLLVIINHDITGNGIDKLKEARTELQDYLIDK